MPQPNHCRCRRRLAAGSALLALAGLAGCSSIADVFSRSDKSAPPVVVTNAEPEKQVGDLPGGSSIPVLVNDQPITRYDINQRARLMALGGIKGGEKAATEELIDETLKMYEALKRGVRVPDPRVDAAFASMARNLKMSPDQLVKGLAQEGIDDASLKKRIRAQMTWELLVQRRSQVTQQIKSADVTERLLAKGNPQEMTVKEFTLQQIIFVVPTGSPAGLFAQRRQEAAAFRQRFNGCDHSLEQAKLLKGVVVKELGRRDSSQLSGPQGEEVQKTPAGKTAAPAQTDQGVELIAVCSIRNIKSEGVARAEIQNQLMLESSEGVGKDYLEELRGRAIIEYR
ncbi:MAG: hypothetical protein WD036_12260 [Bauldia sp.]